MSTRLAHRIGRARRISAHLGPRRALRSGAERSVQRFVIVRRAKRAEPYAARAFVTSANFTEAGVLVDDPSFARHVRDQHDGLVAAGAGCARWRGWGSSRIPEGH